MGVYDWLKAEWALILPVPYTGYAVYFYPSKFIYEIGLLLAEFMVVEPFPVAGVATVKKL